MSNKHKQSPLYSGIAVAVVSVALLLSAGCTATTALTSDDERAQFCPNLKERTKGLYAQAYEIDKELQNPDLSSSEGIQKRADSGAILQQIRGEIGSNLNAALALGCPNWKEWGKE